MENLRYLPRTALTYLLGFLATVVAAPVVILLARFRPHSPAIDRFARAWSRVWLVAAGTDLEVSGREHVEAGRSYVVVANHVSNLDIMACFLAIPLPIRFLAKKELFRVPLLAGAMRAIGIVEVDRAARNAVHDQVNTQVRALVEAGRSVIIYPEGTRTRSGELGPFKKGAFTMAVAGGLPVLPVSILGTYQAWPPASPWVRGGSVRVIIDPPLATEHLTQADVASLRDRARALIAGRVGAQS